MERRDAIRTLSAGTFGAAGLLSSSWIPAPILSRAAQAQSARGTAPVTIQDIKTVLTAPNGIRLVLVKVLTSYGQPSLYEQADALRRQVALDRVTARSWRERADIAQGGEA